MNNDFRLDWMFNNSIILDIVMVGYFVLSSKLLFNDLLITSMSLYSILLLGNVPRCSLFVCVLFYCV